MTRGEFRAPLVGRGPELAELAERSAVCRTGTPQVVVLGGEAGIGKSRLLAEFLDRSDDALAVVGHCLELGPDGPPFAPFTMMLRSLVAELGAERVASLAGPAARDLGVLTPELGRAGGADPLGRGQLFEAMATLIEHASEERPVVIAVEDLHWSDSSTRDLLLFLIRSVTASRVMFVLTYRSDELPRNHPLLRWLAEVDRLPVSSRMTLGRLSDTHVDELVHELAGDVPARTGTRIRERSEGIPFFVEELIATCRGDSTSVGAAPGRPAGAALSDSLRDLLLARLDRLSEPSRAVVRMASAANTQPDHGVLQAMAGMADDALEAALREAVNGQVLVVGADQNGYSFRHALMREAVHADLLPGEHARLHARYAQALEGTARPDQAGEVAHHWMAAHEGAKTFEWSIRAADHSRSVYAWQEELNHVNRALDLWDQVDDAHVLAGGDRMALLQRAGRAAGDAGRSEQAIAFYDAALAEGESPRPQQVARILVERARQCAVPRDTLPDLRRALDLAAEGTWEQAAALCQLAAHAMLAGRLTASVAWAERAIEAAEQADATDLLGHAHNTLGCAQLHTGDLADGFANLERARGLAETAEDWPGLLRYYGNLSDALIGVGRYGEATRVAHEGRTMATERGWNRTMGAFLGGNEAEALVHASRWDDALVTIDDVLRLDPPPITRAQVLIQRSIIRLRRGELSDCADDLDEAVDRLGFGINQPQYALLVAGVRASLEAQAGHREQALGLLADAMAEDTDSLPPSAAWPFAVLCAWLVEGALGSAIDEGLADALAAVGRRLASLARYLETVSGHTGLGALLRAQFHDARAIPQSPREARSAPAPADPEFGDGHRGPVQVEDQLEVEVEAPPPGLAVDRWAEAVAGLLAWEGLRYERAYAQIRLAEHLLHAGHRAEAREHLGAAWRVIDDLGAESLRPMATRVAGTARLQLRPVRRGAELLTDREREVLDLVAAGKSNKAISDELFISIKTTSVHVSHILAKIGASSRTEAAAWAHDNGLARSKFAADSS